MPDLYHLDAAGRLHLGLHPGQSCAWASTRRIVAMFAGTQGGKTSFEPWWLAREIQTCGPGDYLAVTATYDLFKLKFLPAIRDCFEHILRWGRYWASDRIMELANPTTGLFQAHRADDPMWGRIILRSAESGSGLESSTAKAALVDEAGLPAYTVDTWQAILRRLALFVGRVLLGTTIYDLGWLKREIYDPWLAGDPTIDVVQFDSTLNPAFPPAEMERARSSMPAWKFNQFYRGRFERPAGLIYDVFFDGRAVTVPPFAIPPTWPRYWGLDFGGVNTVCLKYAEEPGTGRLFLYSEYKAGGRTAAQHTAALLAGEPGLPTWAVGGSASEDQWRSEFAQGGLVDGEPVPGLPILPPATKSVEVGIQRVYGVHKRDELRVLTPCTGYLADKANYRRVVDEAGEPTEAIAEKSTFHFMDAERYILGFVRPGSTPVVYAPGEGW